MKKTLKLQAFIGFALICLMVLWSFQMMSADSKSGGKLVLYLVTGLLIGYVLTRSRFGFAGGVKRPYMTGSTSLNEALYVMFVVTAIVFAGIHWNAASGGAMAIIKDGKAVIPGIDSVRPMDWGIVVGGLLFGSGMIFAGGCASGTLTDLGEGAVRGLISFIFYLFGAPIGHWLRHVYGTKDVGIKMYLPDTFGYVGTVLLTALGFLVLFIIVKAYSYKRKKAGTYFEPEYEEIEKPLDYANAPFFSYETYHRFFIKRWSFMTGGLLLAFLFIFVLVTTEKAWGVTSAFTTAAVALFSKLGIDFSQMEAFKGEVAKLDKVNWNLLMHPGTVRNIGIVLGSAISFLLAGRFSLDAKFKFKDGIYFAVGGFIMGVGARFARGCNVGALYSAITAFSLHGWGFLIFMTIGGIITLKVFEGKVCVLPKRNI